MGVPCIMKNSLVLLMVQKYGVHQLRLVVDPIVYIYIGSYTSQVVGNGISVPSTVS